MSKEVLEDLKKLLDEEDTWNGEKTHLFDIQIVIPACTGKNGGLGIDTTRLFKLLPSVEQYHHGIKTQPIQGSASYGGWHDGNRKTRQQDVVVSSVSKITDKIWRADINNKQEIVLSINKGTPLKVRKRQKNDIYSHMQTLLKLVSTEPQLFQQNSKVK